LCTLGRIPRASAGDPFKVMQAIKQGFARRLLHKQRSASDPRQGSLWDTALDSGHIWQARFYDFVVFTEKKRVEKLRYMHRVKRGLVLEPQHWDWSGHRHDADGERGGVLVNEERKAEPVSAGSRSVAQLCKTSKAGAASYVGVSRKTTIPKKMANRTCILSWVGQTESKSRLTLPCPCQGRTRRACRGPGEKTWHADLDPKRDRASIFLFRDVAADRGDCGRRLQAYGQRQSVPSRRAAALHSLDSRLGFRRVGDLLHFQSTLVRVHKVSWHRFLGWFGAGLATMMVPLGTATAIIMARFDAVQLHQSGTDAFLSIPFFDMIAFGVPIALAIYWRTKPELHRRLIFIATCSLMDPPIGRFDYLFDHNLFYPCLDLLMVLGVARDLLVDRRVHKVYLYALPLLIVGQSLAVYMWRQNPSWWQGITHAILG
jgi:hypothetical protein